MGRLHQSLVIVCCFLAAFTLQDVQAIGQFSRRSVATWKKTQPALPSLSVPRSVGANPQQTPPSFLDTIFSPQTALKVVAVGLTTFAAQMLLAPDLFVKTYINLEGKDPTIASDFFLMMWAVRELLLALLSWAVATQGTDSLGRFMVTGVFFCLSIPQVFHIVTKDVLAAQVKDFLVVFQLAFFLLFGNHHHQSVDLNVDERFVQHHSP
ncbi:expressed unknown protein [Seminavis robusta]|uniref:Uncharacterized protein n=1 Tax=Seminavis robusta TaxID=568900 RepID=A0A9N8H9S2_9STRA|nr:expressed unknown protein [Seminavis robusta]|eukprot:Sro266_g103050.1 n/a (209) ;mRNA; r:20498-21124